MNREEQAKWEERHRDAVAGDPEPSIVEMIPLLQRGLALDVAAGTGRNSIEMARNGFDIVAVDFSPTAMRSLAATARRESLPITTFVADLENSPPFRLDIFDVIVNVSYLDRDLIPALKRSIRPGGFLLFDTFLVNQAATGHPRDPRFLLKHYELYDLLSDMELIRYREGIVTYPSGGRAWRAVALARRVNF